MPLQSSGSISWSQIQAEHGGSTPISLSEYYGVWTVDTQRPTSGELKASHMHSTGAPVDGVWGDWGSWSSCSASCGGGTQSRSRSLTAATYGGTNPAGSSSESQSCNTHSCVVYIEYMQAQGWPASNCGWSTSPWYCIPRSQGSDSYWYSCWQNVSVHLCPKDGNGPLNDCTGETGGYCPF
jgi:hypothetical protein